MNLDHGLFGEKTQLGYLGKEGIEKNPIESFVANGYRNLSVKGTHPFCKKLLKPLFHDFCSSSPF